MLLLFLAAALTDVQQAKHDANEWALYQRLQSDEAMIADTWRPNATVLLDYQKLQRCYVQFHLYRALDCNAEFAQVDHDLRELEVARTKGR
jgi:hypothetical protein